jgi:uncharacterized protein (TIGR03083 family)
MQRDLEPIGIIPTAHLFPGLHRELMALLRGLTADEWFRPTLARGWLVRDVAAHLLDGDVRRLSFQRDCHPIPQPDRPVTGFPDLVQLFNKLNADWIRAARRVSPGVLMDLMEVTGPQVAGLFATLDPRGPAFFPVAWAGESSSENWFDIGRDYTERWHHQAQIREAVGAPLLDGPEWLRPVFELSMNAFRRALEDVHAAPGTALVFLVSGAAGGTWSVVRSADAWSVFRGAATPAAVRAECDADTAWRLFFNALAEGEARRRVAADGDARLIEKVWSVRGVMV